MKEERIFLFDNLKVLLILLVIFGHLLEIGMTEKTRYIYVIIYLFHMPVFVFCSGYFYNGFNRKKIINKMVLPYLIFQTIYLIFDNLYLKELNYFKLQYATPYWIMWYLLALIFWNIITQFLNFDSMKKQIIVIFCLFVIGLISGLDSSIGYYLSLSRILTFFPFFVLGFYFKKSIDFVSYKNKINKIWRIIISFTLIILFIIIALYIWINYHSFFNQFLYFTYSYNIFYGMDFRLMQYAIAIFMLIILLWFIPNKKMKFSYIGKYTLSIYLLHGFIIKILSKVLIINLNNFAYLQVLLYLMITILLIIILPLFSKLKERIFVFIKNPFIKKI